MSDTTQGDPGAQAANLGAQLGGGPGQGAPQQGNPWQIGGGGGRNPWTMMLDLIRPPGNQPDYLTGERQNPTNTRPQDYIPGDRRESDQWGKPDHILAGARNYPGVTPGPFMPQGQAQMAQVFHQSAAYLGNFGSGAIAPMGGAAAAYQTNYIKGLMQGQEWRARMNRLKMQETAERLQEKQDRESLAYAEIMAGYQDSPQLEEKLREHAYKVVEGTDQPIIDALNAGGVPAAKRVLQERDWHNQNLAKTNQQRKDEEAQKDTEKYLDPKGGQQPGTQPSASRPEPPATTPPTPIAASLPPLPEMGDDLKNDAQAVQMGEQPMALPNTPAAQTGLAHAKNALDRRLQAIIDPRRNIPADQIMPLVRDANPKMAQLAQNILDGTTTPNMAESAKEPYTTALSIARRINPDLNRTTAINEAKNKALGEQSRIRAIGADFGKQLQALSTIRKIVPTNIGDMDRLIDQARKVDTTNLPMLERLYREGKLQTGDPEMARFMSLLHKVQLDAGVILTSANTANPGRYTVYAMKMMDQFLDKGATPEQFRAIGDTLKQDYERMLTPLLGETNALLRELSPNAELEKADEVYAAIRGGDAAGGPKEGDRKQFKQGMGVFRGGKWVPDDGR